MTQRVFSSESVTCGHPDKVCDAVSDAIVDACLAVDPNARVAVETCIKGMQDKSVIILAGEVSLEGETPDYVAIAREAAAEIGYTSHDIGMDATTPALCDVLVYVTTQSAYINQGVDRDSVDSQGAGDQGIMFGFACMETEEFDELNGRFFPLAAALSQRLTRRMTNARKDG
ncbi:MAG: S-adenosylmethionine synthetase N-terminal domain-containing protein, partial [Candidatus Thermoplasmatota archaeon]|nr:S-adenosylmethionine synthetase N-terminal domain-containing protein [Candidatus Thermoplasmatota archaeon]